MTLQWAYCLFKRRHGEGWISVCLSSSLMVKKKLRKTGKINLLKYGLFNSIQNQIIVSDTLDLEYVRAYRLSCNDAAQNCFCHFLLNNLVIPFSGVPDWAVADRGREPLAPDGYQRCSECWALQCLHWGWSAVRYQPNPGGGLSHRPHPSSSHIRSQDCLASRAVISNCCCFFFLSLLRCDLNWVHRL